jgi:hypothetical protein
MGIIKKIFGSSTPLPLFRRTLHDSLAPTWSGTNTLIEDDGRSLGLFPSSIDPSMSSGPGRKNEKPRTKEIATAQKYIAKNQELDYYYAKRGNDGRLGDFTGTVWYLTEALWMVFRLRVECAAADSKAVVAYL